jgi:shikimate dehydrogenase
MEKSYLDSLVGVFGHPVAENPTVIMIEAAFHAARLPNWRYLTIDVPPEKLKDAMEAMKIFGMKGINITLPHEVEVMKYLDEISETAEKIGAVNTVINRDGKLFGENTDGKGFLTALRTDGGVDPKGKRVVVIGAGGAGRAICIELGLAGAAHITVVNRTRERGLELAERIERQTDAKAAFSPLSSGYTLPEDTDILVQATSLGLYPEVTERPCINYDSIRSSMVVCDVIPNPANTPFLQEAAERGAKTLDGLSMLIYQGTIGFNLWTGKEAIIEAMKSALEWEFSAD